MTSTSLQHNEYAQQALRDAESTADDALHEAETYALQLLSAEGALESARNRLRAFERSAPLQNEAAAALPERVAPATAEQMHSMREAITAAEAGLESARAGAAAANERHQAAQSAVRVVRHRVYRGTAG